jgi:surfactin synthase thioesterase subunit
MTAESRDDERRWLKRFGQRDARVDVRLLCFHHAGGSAGMYRRWPAQLPPTIEPIAVQLPGRADRFGEPPFDRMAPLVDELIDVVKPLLDRPFACYGVSMGSRVAWALAHALRERSMPMPNLLYLACDIGPSEDDGTWPWQGRADGLEGYMKEMGGTPAEVLAEPELVKALLPTLRADLDVLSTHRFRPASPLDIPIHAFAGTDDPSAPAHRVTAWRAETTARFDLDVVRSSHFFDADAERQVIQTIGRGLARESPS